MYQKRWMKVFVSVLAMVVVMAMLAACGDDDAKPTQSGSGGKVSTTTAAPSSGSGASDTVTISMHDYAFAVSGKLAAGGSIDLKNEGDELHMLGIGKLKAGATVAQVRDAMAKASPDQEGDPTGGLIEEEVGWPGGFVTPGHEVTLSAANLQPGTYALICFLPTEGSGEPHFTKGMISELDVAAGSSTPEPPKPDATYKVTVGQPMTGPATLTAGTHTIEITGDGDISKQEPQLVRAKTPDQTPDQINDEINKFFGALEGGNTPPPKGTGKSVSDYIAFAGFDLNSLETATFTFDFQPGVYYLAAPDTDNQNGPSTVPKELIKITVS
jgi:hypothetical protein